MNCTWRRVLCGHEVYHNSLYDNIRSNARFSGIHQSVCKNLWLPAASCFSSQLPHSEHASQCAPVWVSPPGEKLSWASVRAAPTPGDKGHAMTRGTRLWLAFHVTSTLHLIGTPIRHRACSNEFLRAPGTSVTSPTSTSGTYDLAL